MVRYCVYVTTYMSFRKMMEIKTLNFVCLLTSPTTRINKIHNRGIHGFFFLHVIYYYNSLVISFGVNHVIFTYNNLETQFSEFQLESVQSYHFHFFCSFFYDATVCIHVHTSVEFIVHTKPFVRIVFHISEWSSFVSESLILTKRLSIGEVRDHAYFEWRKISLSMKKCL